ncbi:hypothetical protein NOSIN_09975 [Nocardiopsis sinuspersici]|uniref:Uncharacterized protein n=1 Tax=Nocardiopsis sinuspersici TaxID=501010 RepID=A0A1V3C0B4_9ACTN|nr:hypothetical protein NOSIN_09975 [Nocardiopsis sinuspersici]
MGTAVNRDQVEAHRDLPGVHGVLACVSVRKPRPLIRPARIFTGACATGGSTESVTASLTETTCFGSSAATGSSKRCGRASTVVSSPLPVVAPLTWAAR